MYCSRSVVHVYYIYCTKHLHLHACSKSEMMEIFKDYGKMNINTRQVAKVLGECSRTDNVKFVWHSTRLATAVYLCIFTCCFMTCYRNDGEYIVRTTRELATCGECVSSVYKHTVVDCLAHVHAIVLYSSYQI